MNVIDLQLPSNKKFGFFFTFILMVVTAYFYHVEKIVWAYIFVALASIFLFITLVKSEALLPLNKVWMLFGLLLGRLISPIVIGIIFLGLFTPIAILMRLSGRDELRLKFVQKSSHWITRKEPINSQSFKNQF